MDVAESIDVAESMESAASPAVLQVKRRSSSHPSSRNVCPKVSDEDEVKAVLEDLIERVERVEDSAAMGDDEYEKMIEPYMASSDSEGETPEVLRLSRQMNELVKSLQSALEDGVTMEDPLMKATDKSIKSLKASIIKLINPGYSRLAKLSESLDSGTVAAPTEQQIERAERERRLPIRMSGLDIAKEMARCVSA